MQKLWFYSNERLQFGTGDKASDAQRNRLGHSRINACGDGTGSSVDEARGSSLLEGEYVTGIRNQVMMHKAGNVPVVQVCSIIEAVDEMVCKLFEDNNFAYKYTRRWTLNGQSLTDAGLVFHTVATWLVYVHAKSDDAKHKPLRDDRALLFLCAMGSVPRREYYNIHTAVSHAQLLGMEIGKDKFEERIKEYVNMPA